MATVTIQDLQVMLTQPLNQRLIVVKIHTSEPGLYGLGCATFTQRFHAVHATLEKHFKPLLIGRDVSRIEDLWHTLMVNGYWRNGPVLNNAVSGVDMALWDIKGKMAGMPVYQLLGGKSREAAAVYVHADGPTIPEVIDSAQALIDQGYRHIRLQMGGYGGKQAAIARPDGALDGAYFDPR
ncbi:MAG: starvation-sensing protein RspA, partial [Chloroflexi bacterium]|nr:starvation-sensing protein RspA [Chloroflexota bacterium]